MTRLRAGVIGAGYMGRLHVRLLGEVPGVEPVVVVDPAPSAHDLGLPVVADLGSLPDLVDFVVLAAPSAIHEPIGLELARLGVPTLIEKPIATTTESGLRLVRAFAKAGTAAAAGHIERFNPVVTAICHALADDAIGPVVSMATSRVGPFPDRDMPVGVVADLLVHDIDLACYLLDARYSSVTAEMQTEPGRPCEDAVEVRGALETTEGRTITVAHRASRLHPTRERSIRLVGERGALEGDFIEQALTLRTTGTALSLPVDQGQPLAAELSAWADVVRGGPPDPVLATLADGLRAVSVAEAVLASARAGGPVTPEVAA
ncbi:Gfo/Idh/MocA family oxidoreductase [Ammonicoccus fulvus]|uniref:Gfo/Idh/MocA family oxidoreductase n=1 Tax=Ammonicoccus fulvus TaxID=3138240 RepID=A0ABZ3FL07_9ACTN